MSFIRQAITLREIWLGMLVCGAASVLLLAIGAAIGFDALPARRSFRMILSKLSRMVRHGSFPMKVVSLHRNNLVRTK